MSSTPKATSEDGGSNATRLGLPFAAAIGFGAVGCYLSFLGPNAMRIQKSVLAPDGAGMSEWLDNFTFVGACIGLCGTFDLAVARLFGAGRYFALHTAVNATSERVFTAQTSSCTLTHRPHARVLATVVCFTWRDALSALSFDNPFDSNSCALAGTPCANKLAMDLTMGLHLWHSLAYALKPIDWIHHIPAHAVCSVGICLAWGPVLLMGIPGGIDYLLLTATKLGMLPPRVEKVTLTLTLTTCCSPPLSLACCCRASRRWTLSERGLDSRLATRDGTLTNCCPRVACWSRPHPRLHLDQDVNQSLNVWLRGPVAVVSAYLMVFGALLHPEHFHSAAHRVGHALIGVHHFWNANFFMYRLRAQNTRLKPHHPLLRGANCEVPPDRSSVHGPAPA